MRTDPFTEVAAFWDQPAIGLSVFQSVSISDSFKTYLRFRPSGTDSIYVTLEYADWNWFGNATEDSFHLWTLDSGDTGGPHFHDVDDFPDWDFVFLNSL